VETRCEEPRRVILQPSQVVRELNRRFFIDADTNPFFTLTYGIVDTAKGTVRLVRAGSPYPLLLSKNGAVRTLKPEGFAIGLFPKADAAVEELRLAQGDRLLLYSDGLSECANQAGEAFSALRLLDLARAGSGLSLGGLVDSIGSQVAGWRGSKPLADDVSLMVVEKI